MNRLISMTRNIAFAVVICGLPCLAKTPERTVQVDVTNYVLYNYDTFDTTQFGMNPSATNVPMKTYNSHISIGDIVAVGGKPAKGTLLCTHTMFVLSPTATVGSMKAIADTSRSMIDDCSLEILTDGRSGGRNHLHPWTLRRYTASRRTRVIRSLQSDRHRWDRCVPRRTRAGRWCGSVDTASRLGYRRSR